MLLNIPQPNILLLVSFNFSPCSQTSSGPPLLRGGGCGVTRARQLPRQLPVTTVAVAPYTGDTPAYHHLHCPWTHLAARSDEDEAPPYSHLESDTLSL